MKLHCFRIGYRQRDDCKEKEFKDEFSSFVYVLNHFCLVGRKSGDDQILSQETSSKHSSLESSSKNSSLESSFKKHSQESSSKKHSQESSSKKTSQDTPSKKLSQDTPSKKRKAEEQAE